MPCIYLEQAGDQAWSQRAHGAAEAYYTEALGRLDAAGQVLDAARVREKLAEALYRVGQHEAVIQVLEPAVENFRTAEAWTSLARVMARVGWAHAWLGRPREGLAHLLPVLGILERVNAPAPLATLYEAVGQILLASGRFDESLAAHERAAALARASGDERLCVLADGHRVNLLQLMGRLGEALRVGQNMLSLAEAVGDHDILRRAHGDLAYLHALRGGFTASRWHIERALTISMQLGDLGERAFVLAIRGWIAVLSGDWRNAHADLDQALALGHQVEGLVVLAYAQIVRALLSLVEGDRAAATTAAREALALAEKTGDRQVLCWAARVMAALELLAGRPEASIVRLVALRDHPGMEDYDGVALLPVLAWAYLEHGQLDEAAATVEQACGRARPEEMRLVLVEALRVRALLALRREQWDEAALSLEEGLSLARDMPYPYAEARLLCFEGQRQSHRGSQS